MIRDPKRDGWRVLMARVGCQSFMDPAPIVVCDVQADGRRMTFDLLRKAVGQSREASRRHADREVAALKPMPK
jgi:hypothetical protein